jgi:hypothetical protein
VNDTQTPAEVTVGHVLLHLMRGLSDRVLKWSAVWMSFGLTGLVVLYPDPWRAGAVALFTALVSPLWLRREKR